MVDHGPDTSSARTWSTIRNTDLSVFRWVSLALCQTGVYPPDATTDLGLRPLLREKDRVERRKPTEAE